MKYLNLLILLLISINLQAQIRDSLNQEVSPKNGINQLAIEFYGIEFTKEQRTLIAGKEIEFIFQIQKDGTPILSEINGVTDASIIIRLKDKARELASFHPRIRNGIAEEAIYFLKLEFPIYQMTQSRLGFAQGAIYNEAKLEDFEYIEKSKTRYDLLVGGMVNQFNGNPSQHLGVGGGMKLDLSYTTKKSYLFGLNMSFYGNKLKENYPIITTREQLSAPPTLLVGLIFGKWFDQFNIQGEINMAVQNITESMGENDPDWVQLKGWSPGIVINYPIKFGKDNPMYYYGAPSIFNNHLNLHFGIRYLDLSIKEASGIMTEFGISYRMTSYGVDKYKFKSEYLER